jgi:aryl sulfotransferase
VDSSNIAWPRKTREIHDLFFDSRVWNDFDIRNDDIIISTWGKSGTTWTQQIIGQMIFNGQEDIAVSHMSPWLEMVVLPLEETLTALKTQTHRRFVKTHLPLDALVFSPKAKYIYVGRDGRDIVWSMHHHQFTFTDDAMAMFNNNPRRGPGEPLTRPTDDVVRYFRNWLAKDGYPWWPFWENVRSWWEVRNLPNVRLLHFENLKKDLAGEMRGIAEFLEIPVDEERWPTIVEHCTFDWMKAHADRIAPVGGIFWEGGATTFINRGTNGRWRDLLTKQDVEAYERRARQELGDACANWLATGKL